MVALVLIAAAIMPKDMHVERAATMNAPAKIVFSKVNNLEAYVQWMPWRQIDTAMKITWPEGASKEGVGANYSWTGNENVGNGKMTIKESVEFESIVTEVQFEDYAPGTGSWKFEEVDGTTNVTWSMDMTMPYPFNFFAMFMPDPGVDFEKGLANLKAVAESTPVIPDARTEEIGQVTLDADMIFMGVTETVTLEELPAAHGRIYTELGAYMGENGLPMTANPLCVYLQWGEQIVMQPGFPVAKAGPETDRIKAGKIAAGTYVRATHIGPYMQLDKSHAAIDAYVTENNLKVTGAPWEHYVDDPGDMSDMSNVKTLIYYPIGGDETAGKK